MTHIYLVELNSTSTKYPGLNNLGIFMATRKIECDSCDFIGTLRYNEDEFLKNDISFCPVCGSDITEDEEYDTEDDE